MASAFFAVAMNLKREALYFRTELETHKTDTKKKLAEQEQKFEDKLADQKAELDECRKQCENDRVSNVSLKETIEGLSELVTAMSRRKKKGPPIRGGTRKTDPPLPSGAPPAVLPRRGHKRKRRSTH